MRDDADRRNGQPAAPAHRRDDAGLARARALRPATPKGGGGAQEDEEQDRHHLQILDLPVAARRYQAPEQAHAAGALRVRRDADGLGQRQREH